MADKIAFSVSAVPLTDISDEGKTVYVVDQEIGRGLTGGNNAATWAGSAIANWAGGVLTNHKNGNGGSHSTLAGDDGVWFKNTGFGYDAGETSYIDYSTPRTDDIVVVVNTKTIATLGPGEAIFLPGPGATTFDFTCATNTALEYATFS